MKRDYYKSGIAHDSLRCICLAAVICAIFFGICGFAFAATASDEADTSLNGTNLNDTNLNDSAVQSQVSKEMLISGTGSGELLLTFTVNKVIPVFSGRYSYDVIGIHVPPISTPVQVDLSKGKGYSYDLANVYIPGKPNNFTISASGVKTLSIGLKELPGTNETNEIWKTTAKPRAWLSTQAEADEKGIAKIDSDLVSPSVYDAKIFGDAAEGVSQVKLTMSVVKKLVVKGPYNLSINTTGFPEGDYSFGVKALNGTFKMNEISIES